MRSLVSSRVCQRCSRLLNASTALTHIERRRLGHSAAAPPKSPPTTQWFSGIQPTGVIHIGNYLGAIQPWITRPRATGDNPMLVSIVDLHALTAAPRPADLVRNTREMAAFLIATGLLDTNAKLFVQSHVNHHSELGWLLQCVTPYSWLTRMTQFKDKAQSMKSLESASSGLFSYPTLMAADILLYRASHIPVGDDQSQHLELTRDIVDRFNSQYKCQLLMAPAMVKSTINARVMSLRNASKKMSKSDPSDMSRVSMLDSDEQIAKKIQGAVTDSIHGLSLEPGRPEIANLVHLLAATSNQSVDAILADSAYVKKATFKAALTEALVAFIGPVRAEYRRVLSDPSAIDSALKDGAQCARERAAATMTGIRAAMGLMPPL